MEATGKRLAKDIKYPNTVYLETVGLFLLSNYIYHQNVFKANGNRLQFGLFLLANAFTSY